MDTAVSQYVYLDFDGERTSYRNRDLNLTVSVTVQNPAFSNAQKQEIVSALTEKYKADGVVFTTEKPQDASYSTVYFGESSAFKKYGDFFGVSETIDGNNKNASDNAFVLLNSSYSTDQIIAVASDELDNLLGNSITLDRKKTLKDYAAKSVLLSTKWTQYAPYNDDCPLDPKTQERCLTGCTNTAAAQIIYHWIEAGTLNFSLTLDESDAYMSNDISISASSRDAARYDYLSFSDTNRILSNFKLDNTSCISALCFAAGVVQKAVYSSSSTSTAWDTELFVRSGFQSSVRYLYSSRWYFQDDHRGLTATGRSLLISELLAGRPVGASLNFANGRSAGQARHTVVIDGYNSATDEFHVNFGWAGEDDGWYSLDTLGDKYGLDEILVGLEPETAPRLTLTKLSFSADAVGMNEDITVSFRVSNKGTEKSKAATVYVYSGQTLLKTEKVSFVSAGCSRDVSCTINSLSLPFGSSSVTVKVNSQDKSGSFSSQSRSIRVFDSSVSDADDNWTAASSSALTKTTLEYDTAGLVAETVLTEGEYVGYYDHKDYREITIEHAGKYTFTLSGLESSLELTVYGLTEKNKLKKVKSGVISASKGRGQLTDVPLEKGTYYICVKAANWENHGDSTYTLTVSGEGFLAGDNRDDWTDLQTEGSEDTVPSFGTVTQKTGDIIIGEWVGLGDAVDYRKITLESAAKLSFLLSATDAVKFTVCILVENPAKSKRSLKALQTTSLKKADNYQGKTAPLLLEAGDYYIAMQSTNAAKGGSADYDVKLGANKFYLDGDGGWNNWIYKAKEKKTNKEVCGDGEAGEGEELSAAVVLGRDRESSVQFDKIAPEFGGWNNFVGFGDDADYVKIELKTAAKLSFTVSASDAAKLVICRLLRDDNGIVVGVKTLQTTKLKLKDKAQSLYAAASGKKLLASGEYYLAVLSTNAKKGGEAYYNVNLDADASVFFDSCDGGENGWLFNKKKDGLNTAVSGSAAAEISKTAVGGEIQLDDSALGVTVRGTVYNNFVGYGDSADYAKIHVSQAGSAVFTVRAADAAKFVICQLVYNKKNEVTGANVLQTTKLVQDKETKLFYSAETKPFQFKEEGDYYIAVLSTNAKKGGGAFYNVTLLDTDIVGVIPDSDALDGQASDVLTDGLPQTLSGDFDAPNSVDDVVSAGIAAASDSMFSDETSAWLNIASLA